MKKIYLSAILLLSICHYNVHAQALTSKQIDLLVTRAFELTPSVGIAIAVVKDGKVIHAKGYGLKSSTDKTNVDENTLFEIASNSKAFTTAALAILVDEGKLEWHDKVIDYIPEFRMYDDYVTANFNIEDLLTHRSGLGLGAGDLMFFPDGADFTIHDILLSFQYQQPVSPFRTKYDYDNLLYIVAGELIKRVSGQSWSDFVQTRIFTPLGMTHSVPVSERLPKDANLALPHSSYGGNIIPLKTYQGGEIIGAAGGICASVSDLSKWMMLQLNKGKYGENLGKTLFTEKQQKEMWYPHTIMGFNVNPDTRTNNHFTAYGLGWGISDKKGKIIIQHTGGLPGMLSRTILVPELNLGIVVLTNSDPGGYSFYSIPETILDSYLGIEKNDWIKTFSDRASARGEQSDSVTKVVWETVKRNQSATMDTIDYVGTYKDNWFGEITISVKDGMLWFTSKRSPKLNGPMYFYKATTFAIKWEYTDMPCDAFATFHLNEEGKATDISMKGISPNIDFSFDFHDLHLKKVDN